MKPLKKLVNTRGRTSARVTFILASCVAAAAVAIAAPPRLTSNSPFATATAVPTTSQDALPPSMSSTVQVMVEMDAPAGAVLYAEALKEAQANLPAVQPAARVPMSAAQKGQLPKVEIDSASAARVVDHISALDAAQQAVLPSIANAGGTVIFRTQRAYNGIAVSVSPDRIADLAKMPGVKAVRPMIPKYKTAFSDVDFLGARSFWNKPYSQGVGIHGEGVKIAIIDTGVDYTHANFGGPGNGYSGITDTSPVPNAYFPNAKFPFGTDLAGDAYTGRNTPMPDPNPLDSNEHGTSCASLAAGFGENAGGTTYRGNYDSTTPINTMKISPGQAPLAQIVPIRVFGTNGSTNLVTQAIDYAIDPNKDGNFSDHVDIISMSLGSDTGSEDDSDAVAVTNAAAVGVIVASASGNAGDTYYITSSPGAGRGGLSIAASFNDQAGFISDINFLVNSPANLRGSRSNGVYGSPSPVAADNTTRDVVSAESPDANPTQGCTAYTSANASAVAGKIALVDRGTCSFVIKVQNAQAAGAQGIIVANNQGIDPITMALDNSTNIPAAMISQADGNSFRTSAVFNPVTGVAANGANVTVFNGNNVVSRQGISADTMPTYSSRGPLQGSNALKPDLTAPAEVVGTANTGTGTGVRLFNGTSSATPHVAGGLALMKQLHPTWTVEEIMALAMNTANHDLFVESGTAGASAPTGTRRGVSRVGAGRLDLTAASNDDVVVFNSTDRGRVSVSFGNVEVPVDGSIGITKNVTIRNKGTTDITYNGAIQMLNTVGDTNFSAPQTQVIAPAGKDVTFPLLLRATGNTLKHTRDASVSNGQAVTGGTLGRHWLSEAAGYGVLTPTSGSAPAIRIPLYVTIKPSSAMHVAQSTITPSGDATYTLNLTGTPVNTTGAGANGTTGYPTDIISLAKVLSLQYVNPGASTPGFSSDPNVIRTVGVTSDYSSRPSSNKQPTIITFAIQGFGDASTPSFLSSDKEIFIDLNGDGVDDYAIYLDSRASGTVKSNVYYPVLVNLSTNAGTILAQPTNVLPSNIRDTNSFNNSVVLVSVPAALLGYTGQGQSFFNYSVATFGRDGNFVDGTPRLRFDIARPGFDPQPNGNTVRSDGSGTFLEPYYYNDLPGTSVPVNFNGANFAANGSKGIMVVHMHNSQGSRVDVVTVQTPKITSFSPTQGAIGTAVTISGSNFTNDTGVTFSPNVPAAQVNVISANTISCRVPAGATTGPITVANAVGASRSSNNFTVVPAPSPSPSPSASPSVSPTGRNPRLSRAGTQ